MVGRGDTRTCAECLSSAGWKAVLTAQRLTIINDIKLNTAIFIAMRKN